MKYVWALVFLILMSGTWYFANAESNYNIEDNARAEANFAQMIIDSIRTKRPKVTDVHFLQLYTEIIVENKFMRVHFKYEIEEPTSGGDTATQTIAGVAQLNSEDNGESWLVQTPDSISDEINFKNGVKIFRDQGSIGSGDHDTETQTIKKTEENKTHE